MILTQATVSAVAGYVLGMAVSLVVVQFSRQTALPISLTPQLAVFLFVGDSRDVHAVGDLIHL